jgi:hypothetical protein
MSGPTAQQTELGDAQLAAYQQAAQMTQTQYENQQAIYAPMVSQFSSIFAKGPNQEGFSTEEENQLNSQAVEGTAENYQNAARATGEKEAAEGGGDIPLTQPQQLQQQEGLATSAAQEESRQEQQIQQADYGQGLQDWEQAGQGLQAIAAGESPLGYESNETGAGSAAEATEGAIASEDDSWINAAIGAAGSAAGVASGAYLSKH